MKSTMKKDRVEVEVVSKFLRYEDREAKLYFLMPENETIKRLLCTLRLPEHKGKGDGLGHSYESITPSSSLFINTRTYSAPLFVPQILREEERKREEESLGVEPKIIKI